MKYKQWYAKTVNVEELEVTALEIQRSSEFRIEYIRETPTGKFVVVWFTWREQ